MEGGLGRLVPRTRLAALGHRRYSGGHEVKQCCPLAAVGAMRAATVRVQGCPGGARGRRDCAALGASPCRDGALRCVEGSSAWSCFLRPVASLSHPNEGNARRCLCVRPLLARPPWQSGLLCRLEREDEAALRASLSGTHPREGPGCRQKERQETRLQWGMSGRGFGLFASRAGGHH